MSNIILLIFQNFNMYIKYAQFFMGKTLDIIGILYKKLMNENNFNILVTSFVGISALIIALIVFVMDKSDTNNKSIFKIALIENSNIRKLIKYTIVIFSLIILQIVIPFNNVVFIIRILISTITLILVKQILNSFLVIIKIFTDKGEKTKQIDIILRQNIKSSVSKNKILNKEMEEFKKEFFEIFNKKNSYITYESGYLFDYKKRYKVINSDRDGKIEKVNLDNLKIINNKIEKFISNQTQKNEKKEFGSPSYLTSKIEPDKKDFENNYLVLKKIEGEYVNEKEVLFYIDKRIEKLNIQVEEIYKITSSIKVEELIIENEIVDLCKKYINGINNNDIYEIKQSKSDFKKIYETIIEEKAEYFLNILYDNIIEIYRNYGDRDKINLSQITYSLSYISLTYDLYDEFCRYYNIYFYLRKDVENDDEIYAIMQNLKFMKSIIEDDDKLVDKEKYYIFLLSLKQKLFKEFFENKKYDKILQNISNENDIKIYNLNSHINMINRYKQFPERYNNLNLEETIKKENIEYNKTFNEMLSSNMVILNIAEWIRYKYNKTKDKKMLDILQKIIEMFKYYDINDLFEIYLESLRFDNEITKMTHFWEFEEPENKNQVISPQFDIYNIILLIIIKSEVSDMSKLQFRNYLKKENIYTFKRIEISLENVDEEFLKIISLKDDEYKRRKEKTIKYVQNIIKLCQNDEDCFIQNFHIGNENELMFKRFCIEKLKKEQKKSEIFKFLASINKIQYSNEIGKSFKGFNRIENKEFYTYDLENSIKQESERYCEAIVEDQEKKIVDKIFEQAQTTNQTIDEIISKFKNKDTVYILTPYITNDFLKFDYKKNINYYEYKSEDKKIQIPVISNIGFKDSFIICDIESIGIVKYFKVDIDNNNDLYADDYTMASLQDFLGRDKIIKEIIEQNPSWLPQENKENSLKQYCNIKLYQDVRYIENTNGTIYKKTIRD